MSPEHGSGHALDRRRWTARICTAFAVWAVLVLVARVLGNHPDTLLLGLTIAAFATTVWLYLDVSTGSVAPLWDREDDERVRPPGEDPRLALLVRVVSRHFDAREADDTMQRHLLELADQRLVARHGVSWRVDPERAAPLLGPDLLALARQAVPGRPPARMSPAQIDVLLSRIEAL